MQRQRSASGASITGGGAALRARLRGAVFFAAFVLAGALSLVFPVLGFYALLVIIPLDFFLRPTKAQAKALGEASQAAETGGD